MKLITCSLTLSIIIFHSTPSITCFSNFVDGIDPVIWFHFFMIILDDLFKTVSRRWNKASISRISPDINRSQSLCRETVEFLWQVLMNLPHDVVRLPHCMPLRNSLYHNRLCIGEITKEQVHGDPASLSLLQKCSMISNHTFVTSEVGSLFDKTTKEYIFASFLQKLVDVTLRPDLEYCLSFFVSVLARSSSTTS